MMISKDMAILTNKYNRLRKVTGEVLVTDFESLIAVPRTCNLSDWLIINLVDFLERVELLFSSCSLFCTPDTCPMFNAGPHYHYFWEDADTEQPIQLSAPEYFSVLKRWIKRNLQNTKLFPKQSGTELIPEAVEILKSAYRRLFRILAHLYMCHFNHIREFQFEVVINTVLAHYTDFALRYEMITPQHIEMLQPVFVAMGMPLPGIPETQE